jgi:hypothetical protein
MSNQSSPTKYTQGELFDFGHIGGMINDDEINDDNFDDFNFDQIDEADEADEPQGDQLILDENLFERGQSNSKWLKFGKNFKSFNAYDKRIKDFLGFVDTKVGKIDVDLQKIMSLFKEYCEERHELTKVNSLNLMTLQP